MAKKQEMVARRYARALFELYPPAELEGARNALAQFAQIWDENAELRGAMTNPLVSRAEREGVLLQIAEKLGAADERIKNFLRLLVENDRVTALYEASQAFSAMCDQLRKALALKVLSAFELPADERQAAQDRIRSEFGALASISWSVDRDLLGGLIISCGDRLLDSSVRGSLEKIRTALSA